jgi:hypothetical protein
MASGVPGPVGGAPPKTSGGETGSAPTRVASPGSHATAAYPDRPMTSLNPLASIRVVVLGALAMAMLGFPLAHPAGAGSLPPGCRSGDPLANVGSPGRLKVLSRCVEASGVVQRSVTFPDGDVHIDVKLDPRFVRLLNAVNRRRLHGALVVEIVPADQPGCRRGRPVRDGTCTGAHIATPRPGSHVALTGPHVLDRGHGWLEIHPLWRLVVR